MRTAGAAAALDRLVRDLPATDGVSACSALVATPEAVLWEGQSGWRRFTPAGRPTGRAQRGRPPGPEDLFDLASLTKPWTATLALRLDEAGRLPLDLELGEVWPRVDPRWTRATLAELLSHRARLAAWAPLYRRCRDAKRVPGLLLGDRLPPARRGTYSDLGFILWGLTAERVLGRRLDKLLREHLTAGLPEPVAFRPPAARAVECRLDNRREVELAAAQGVRVALRGGPPPGRPQDGNARFLGDVAGHAGLFATARALGRLGQEWLAPGGLLRPGSVRRALSAAGRFHLGWARRTRRGSAGPALSEEAFGHNGFTGGSLWIDPAASRICVLLLHRTRVDFDPDPWRRRFHRLAVRLQ